MERVCSCTKIGRGAPGHSSPDGLWALRGSEPGATTQVFGEQFEAMAPQAAIAALSAILSFTRTHVDRDATAGEAADVLGSGCLGGCLEDRVSCGPACTAAGVSDRVAHVGCRGPV